MKYTFEISCPRCGGDVTHTANAAPTPPLTTTTRAVTHCARCDADWLLILELAGANRPIQPQTAVRPYGNQRPPCGTNRGYGAHLRRGEPTCAACREAHRLDVAAKGRSHHKKKVDA